MIGFNGIFRPNRSFVSGPQRLTKVGKPLCFMATGWLQMPSGSSLFESHFSFAILVPFGIGLDC